MSLWYDWASFGYIHKVVLLGFEKGCFLIFWEIIILTSKGVVPACMSTSNAGMFPLPHIYAPNTRAPSYVKGTLLKLKSHIKPHTLILGDINTLLSPLDRSVRQKINREIRELTDVMTQIDLTNIYRTFHLNTKEYTFFSASHGWPHTR